ncbi:MAG: NAD(P)-dependent oxidoreductase [candidate division NC10 bacterium RBG_16_65_8]|nr:MAG: NAD(P)-dependent oxidoreductase [candidate division NC10 bacterium RBG_16_65_8]
MRKLLVTGASGVLGWNVCAMARGRWRTLGIVHRHPIDLPGVARLTCDLTRPEELRRIFRKVAPDAVVHCAAETSPDLCQAHPDESRRINVEVPADIARLCAGAGVPCAFVSTDLVFDGTRPPYREGDPVSPIGVYGDQKAAAERAVREQNPGAVVCRLPPIFGDPGPASASFIQPWIAALHGGRELRLFTDEFRTPVGARTAAMGLLMALGVGSGILHLGGRERISRYDLGILLAEILGADAGLITPGQQRDRAVGAPRPPDVSLDSSRAYALGYDPPSLRRELTALLRTLSVIG